MDMLPILKTIPQPLAWLIDISIALWYIIFAISAFAEERAETPSVPAPLV
jgi:hypothetical protein